MPPKSIPIVSLAELEAGKKADFFAVLVDRSQKTTREGKPYFTVKLRDRSRSYTAQIWCDHILFQPCEKDWSVGDHLKVRATLGIHERFGAQLEIENARLVEENDRTVGYDPSKLQLSTAFDVDHMFAELVAIIKTIDDAPLRTLVLNLACQNESAIKEWPAAKAQHHAYRGGYLEHTLNVTTTGAYLVEKYRKIYPHFKPTLNRDLVIAGCVLHDIGKVQELVCGVDGGIYTAPGMLIGHIFMGMNMVREAAKSIPDLNPELLMFVEHMIASHQGTREWGSIIEPMIPEALLVHFADNIDAKMNTYVNIIETSPPEGPFTDTRNIMGKRLLKERSV